ncbi:MAG: transcriptional repressor [Actinomycetia bacterium]|nr:transcriptional repressor [Actinomycetes bacterium]
MSSEELHELVAARLRRAGQRYTTKRRSLVEILAGSDQPVTIHQVLETEPSMPQSSAYRNMAILEQAEAVNRIVTSDDFARFELSQELTEHHHHLICTACGQVTDFTLPPSFEDDLTKRLDRASKQQGFVAEDHRLDVIGTCARCHAP